MEDLGGDAQVEVEGWPVNSAVELTMVRFTSVNKVRNGWGIEAAVLDYKLIYGQHSPLSNNQPVVVGNHNNESTMHMCTGKTYKANNNGW